jgi:hypothetical protein
VEERHKVDIKDKKDGERILVDKNRTQWGGGVGLFVKTGIP